MSHQTQQRYAVVTFTKDNDDDSDDEDQVTSEVPSCWLTDDLTQCWWPRIKDVRSHIIKSSPPVPTNQKWGLFDIIFEGYFDSLTKARKAAQDITDSSQDEVACAKKRPVKKNNKYEDFVQNSSDEYMDSNKISSPPKLLLKKENLKKIAVTKEIVDAGTESKVSSGSRNGNKPIVTDNIPVNIPVNILSLKKTPQVVYTEPMMENSKNQDVRNMNSKKLETIMEIIDGTSPNNEIISMQLLAIEDKTIKIIGSIATLIVSVNALSERMENVERALNVINVLPVQEQEFEVIRNTLPLQTVENAVEFNRIIQEDADKQIALKKYLQNVGGNSPKECITRMLSKTFSVSLASLSSWCGQRGNFKVGDLKIIEIIKDTIQESYQMCTDKYFETEWFRQGTQKRNRLLKKGDNRIIDDPNAVQQGQ